MNKKVIQIVKEIQNRYKDTDTILLFGSATKSDWTDASDIDIFLIDDSLKTSREDITIGGIAVELQKDNFATLSKDITAEQGRLLNRNLSTMIATSEIIKTNSPKKIESLKNSANATLKSKPTYTPEDVAMWHYSIKDYLEKSAKDLARNDPVAFYLDANYVIQNALELSLATHGAYLPQPKHLATLLAKIDPDFLKTLQSFVTAPTLPKKLQILQTLE